MRASGALLGLTGFASAAHPLEMGILFFCMIFIGPGKYSIDRE